VLRGVRGPFDRVYIDGDKRDCRRCLDLTLPFLAVGGMVVVDNLLWKGAIADPKLRAEDDTAAREIERFNPYFMIHPQLATALLPLGDGVGVKKQLTIRELGGPFQSNAASRPTGARRRSDDSGRNCLAGAVHLNTGRLEGPMLLVLQAN